MQEGGTKKARSVLIDRSKLKRLEDAFDLESELGKGTHGSAFLATERATGAKYAMKRLDYDPKHERLAMREIKALQKLRHPNIIHLCNILVDRNDKIVLQLELCQSDFGVLLKTPRMGGCSVLSSVGAAQIKGYLLQVFQGVAFMHEKDILHRDIKPENIMLTQDNVVKIIDFGLSREHVQDFRKYTRFMQTLWYRAPEMCMGFSDYTTKADMWSLGCLMGEFLYGTTMFAGNASLRDIREQDQSQLTKIYELCGTPHPPEWPVDKRQMVRETYKHPIARPFLRALLNGRNKHQRKSYLTDGALETLDRLFVLLPEKRLSAKEILELPYFKVELPRPYDAWQMIRFQGESNLNKNVSRKRK